MQKPPTLLIGHSARMDKKVCTAPLRSTSGYVICYTSTHKKAQGIASGFIVLHLLFSGYISAAADTPQNGYQKPIKNSLAEAGLTPVRLSRGTLSVKGIYLILVFQGCSCCCSGLNISFTVHAVKREPLVSAHGHEVQYQADNRYNSCTEVYS